MLTRAKAYAALIGAVLTALLGTVPPHTQLWTILTALAAVATGVTTYAVPNTSGDNSNPGEDGAFNTPGLVQVLLGVFLLLGILWFLGVHVHVG